MEDNHLSHALSASHQIISTRRNCRSQENLSCFEEILPKKTGLFISTSYSPALRPEADFRLAGSSEKIIIERAKSAIFE